MIISVVHDNFHTHQAPLASVGSVKVQEEEMLSEANLIRLGHTKSHHMQRLYTGGCQ